MELTEVFDEYETARLLSGDATDIGNALVLIDRHLRYRLCGWLRTRFPALDADELANTWSDILLGVLTSAQRGGFDGSRPLFPWLCKIAFSRAVDHVRRATARRTMLAELRQALRNTRVAHTGRLLSPEEGKELVDLIQEAIATLPPQQNLVLRVFVEYYPDTAVMNVLQREVSREAGQVVTMAAVKRALQEGRAKVRVLLRRKGYCLGAETDR